MRIHIGTSGYNYPEWKGSFYPPDIKSKDMFAFYRERFRTVEINATFYRMPTPKTTEGWRAQAIPGFVYALKAPRRITHEQRLKDCAEHVQFFVDSARLLGEHLGPLLFQLPPNLKLDMARFEAFLACLPSDIRAAFEFRHESWLTSDVFEMLAQHRVALCIADFGDKSTPVKITARHGYFRLRDEGYTRDDLARWVAELEEHAPSWDDVFVYFKHEEEGKGPEFAATFREILAERGMESA